MAEAALPPLPANCEFSVISRHGNPLPARQRWLFFGVLVAFSLGVGLTLSAWGAWPVLPYSLLETSVVCVVFWYVESHAHDWERLMVAGDRIILERSCAGRCERREFNRHWARVELEQGGSRVRRHAR